MSKKKSLGSSPIGFKSKSSTMGFIPDLGVSKKSEKKESNTSIAELNKATGNSSKKSKKEKQSKKKVVSYNLEVDLVDKVKVIARQKEMYYSSLVSRALKNWIRENG